MSSIEQYSDFHVVRRILSSVEPTFRLVANPSLIKGGVALDCRKKTIEVGEGSDMKIALAAMLFSIGHLFLKRAGRYNYLFGEGLSFYKGDDSDLIEKLISDGVEADKLAMSWASQALQLFWGMTREEALDLVSRYVWDELLWTWHFQKVVPKDSAF